MESGQKDLNCIKFEEFFYNSEKNLINENLRLVFILSLKQKKEKSMQVIIILPVHVYRGNWLILKENASL